MAFYWQDFTVPNPLLKIGWRKSSFLWSRRLFNYLGSRFLPRQWGATKPERMKEMGELFLHWEVQSGGCPQPTSDSGELLLHWEAQSGGAPSPPQTQAGCFCTWAGTEWGTPPAHLRLGRAAPVLRGTEWGAPPAHLRLSRAPDMNLRRAPQSEPRLPQTFPDKTMRGQSSHCGLGLPRAWKPFMVSAECWSHLALHFLSKRAQSTQNFFSNHQRPP